MSEVMSEVRAMETIWTALQPLQPNARQRVVSWLLGVLDMPDEQPETREVVPAQNLNGSPNGDSPSSEEIPSEESTVTTVDLSPKEFISKKNPKTSVERMACLAFFLTHNRATPYFSNADIEKLNTQAAGPTINPYRDLDSARRAGYLAPAEDRKRQITAKGEELVNTLPDREAVKALTVKYGPQRKRRNPSTKRREANGDSE